MDTFDAVVIHSEEDTNSGVSASVVQTSVADFTSSAAASTSASAYTEAVSSSLEMTPFSYFCPNCHKLCKEGMKVFCWTSILCETCKFWFHMKCVGLTKQSLKQYDGKPYICKECILEKRNKVNEVNLF